MIIRTNKLTEGMAIEEKRGELILTKAVNIEPILESNFQSRKDPNNGFSKDKNWRRVMSVPMETLMVWKQEFPEIMSGDREAEESALKILINREENKIFSTVEKVNGIF